MADSWIVLQAGSVGPKLLAIKFLETFVLQFTLDSNDFETCNPEGNGILINNNMSELDFGSYSWWVTFYLDFYSIILCAFVILVFSHYTSDSALTVAMIRQGRLFNVSWIMDGHPVLDPPALISDANRYLGFLLDMLMSASNFPGSLTITGVNRWAFSN